MFLGGDYVSGEGFIIVICVYQFFLRVFRVFRAGSVFLGGDYVSGQGVAIAICVTGHGGFDVPCCVKVYGCSHMFSIYVNVF